MRRIGTQRWFALWRKESCAAQLARDIGASMRLRYAIVLGFVGVVLLSAVAFLDIQRQRTNESRAARIAPIDEAGSGYYVVDPPVEPIVPTDRARRPMGLLWLAAALLIVAVGCGTWYIADRRDRQQEETLHGYRRPRAAHPPSRIVAKRQAIIGSINEQAKDSQRCRLTVRQLMTEAVVQAGPATSIATLTNLLMSGPLRHVLICDYGGRLLGIVTDRDLRHRRGKRAADIMTREPVCIPPGALLGPAAAVMVDHQISCLPVVEQGHLRGVLTSDQMILALQCVLQSRETVSAEIMPCAQETAILSDVQTLCVTARPSNSGASPAVAEVRAELPS